MVEKDSELEAIQTLVAALTPLKDDVRARVLEYVLKRLDMATIRAPIGTREATDTRLPVSGPRVVTDIRSLKEDKAPQSASEMAALVAFYLSELAAQDERSDTVNADAIRRYFKMASYRLPKLLKNVLP